MTTVDKFKYLNSKIGNWLQSADCCMWTYDISQMLDMRGLWEADSSHSPVRGLPLKSILLRLALAHPIFGPLRSHVRSITDQVKYAWPSVHVCRRIFTVCDVHNKLTETRTCHDCPKTTNHGPVSRSPSMPSARDPESILNLGQHDKCRSFWMLMGQDYRGGV